MSDYWNVRSDILLALKLNEDAKLKEISALHPAIFKNVVNQAKNASKGKNK